MSEIITIIGCDCATQAKNTGLSIGLYSNGILKLKETTIGSSSNSIAQTIYQWFKTDIRGKR